jgi:hypothetical protein
MTGIYTKERVIALIYIQGKTTYHVPEDVVLKQVSIEQAFDNTSCNDSLV